MVKKRLMISDKKLRDQVKTGGRTGAKQDFLELIKRISRAEKKSS